MTVDAKVELKGVIGSPQRAIDPGNIGRLAGRARIAYPSSAGDFDIFTEGFTMALDSENGNAFA